MNLRHIGLVRRLLTVATAKDAALVEIVARGMKHQLLSSLRNCVLHSSAASDDAGAAASTTAATSPRPVSQSLAFLFEKRSPADAVAHFLNHLCGSVTSVRRAVQAVLPGRLHADADSESESTTTDSDGIRDSDQVFWSTFLATVRSYYGPDAVSVEDVARVRASDGMLRDIIHLLLDRCGIVLQQSAMHAALSAEAATVGFLFTPMDVLSVIARVRTSSRWVHLKNRNGARLFSSCCAWTSKLVFGRMCGGCVVYCPVETVRVRVGVGVGVRGCVVYTVCIAQWSLYVYVCVGGCVCQEQRRVRGGHAQYAAGAVVCQCEFCDGQAKPGLVSR